MKPNERKPYMNEHSARLRDPDSFDTCRSVDEDMPDGVRYLYCQLKNSESWAIQAYRFDADKWTVSQAKKWLKDNDITYILFEEATG